MLKYHLISIQSFSQKEKVLVDAAFELWMNTYSEILAESGETLNYREFWEKDLLACLVDYDLDQPLIGLHLYSFLDLHDAGSTNNRYIEKIPRTLFHESIKPHYRFVMTGEYLTVAKAQRGGQGHLPYSQMIVGLCSKVFLASGYDLIIGISRKDRRVDKLTENVGAHGASTMALHNIACEVMLATPKDIQKLKNSLLQKQIDILWSQKSESQQLIARKVA